MTTIKINEDQDFVVIQPNDIETKSACQISGPVSGINAIEAVLTMVIMTAENAEKRSESEIIGKDGIQYVKELKRIHDDFRRTFKVVTKDVRAGNMEDSADLSSKGNFFFFPPTEVVN